MLVVEPRMPWIDTVSIVTFWDVGRMLWFSALQEFYSQSVVSNSTKSDKADAMVPMSLETMEQYPNKR